MLHMDAACIALQLTEANCFRMCLLISKTR